MESDTQGLLDADLKDENNIDTRAADSSAEGSQWPDGPPARLDADDDLLNPTPEYSIPGDETPTAGDSSSRGCLAACSAGSKRPVEQRRLLAFNVAILVWSVLVAGLMLIELKFAFGQCMIGMKMYAGGLEPAVVQRFWCKCPLYTVLLAAAVAWLSVMINWVSDLHSKRAAFYKWLKWQAGLTAVAGVGVVGSAGLTVTGFISWCSRIRDALQSDEGVIPNYPCYEAASVFDGEHRDEFVKLYDTFFYTVGITVLIIVHLALWVGANVYTLRLLRIEPKDNFNLSAYRAACMVPPPPPSLYPGNQSGRAEQGRGEGQARDVQEASVVQDAANGGAIN